MVGMMLEMVELRASSVTNVEQSTQLNLPNSAVSAGSGGCASDGVITI